MPLYFNGSVNFESTVIVGSEQNHKLSQMAEAGPVVVDRLIERQVY